MLFRSVSQSRYCRVKSSKRIVNPYEIFALKQGDSMSNMGQHRWVLEPNAQDLANAIRRYIAESKSKSVDTTRLTTWTKAFNMYDRVLKDINDVQSTRRARL